MELGDVVSERFVLERIAGSGAFGRVFRALDRETGDHVALKVIEEARREVVERFKREVLLLASLAHPNVVRHVASGVHEHAHPYLAMEWLEGEDLARRLARERLSAAELIDLARSIASALATAHVRGIVHRDVKPGNVWLVGGSAAHAKLLDFGLARLAAHSTLTRVGTFLGTPEYMSPEQVKGAETLDQRADLFSLGCVLFEAATGRTPFWAPTPLAVATRVLLDEVPRLDVVRRDIPSAFATLVGKLVAKAPEDRPSADAIATMIRTAEEELRTRDDADAPPTQVALPRSEMSVVSPRRPLPSGPSPSAFAPPSSSNVAGRATSFAGRSAELSRLAAAFDACVRSKTSQGVLLEGRAGSGKTRLAREFVAQLARRASPLLIALRGDASRRGEPLGALSRATIEALGLPPISAGLPALQAALRSAMQTRLPASHAPRVTAFFGELVGAPFPDDEHPLLAAARSEGARTGDQVARAWNDWLDAELHVRPAVVLLDDAPLIDPPSLEVVAAALTTSRRRRLLVVTVARPGGRELLPDALVGPRTAAIAVDRLDRPACEAIVREALAEKATDGVVAAIVERSDGHPTELEELVRAVSKGADVNASPSLDAMLAARLQSVDAEAREVIEAASVLGLGFDELGVVTLLEGRFQADQVLRAIDRLVEGELLGVTGQRAATPDDRHLAFRHASLRDGAYAAIGEARRAALHARAARWLARSDPGAPGVIAEHLVVAGEAEPARAFFRRAALVSLEANDFGGAIGAVERALFAGASDEELGQLHLLAAEASRHLGAHARMLEGARLATRTLPAWSRPWFRATALVVLGALRVGTPEVLADLVPSLEASLDREDLPSAAARTAHYLFFTGHVELADRLLRATAEATPDVEPDRDAWVARARATQALQRGDVARYVDQLLRAVEGFERAGDEREQAAERVNAGFSMLELGLFEEAEPLLRAGLEGASRAGLRHVEDIARVHLGEALARLGRAPEALALLDAAIGALRRREDRRLEGAACAYRARLHVAGRELEAAWRDASRAVELAEGPSPARAFALAVCAHVHVARGRADEALPVARAAMVALGASPHEEGEGYVRWVAVEAAFGAGDFASASALQTEASAHLTARAQRISNAPWRARFLAIPEHAATLHRAPAPASPA